MTSLKTNYSRIKNKVDRRYKRNSFGELNFAIFHMNTETKQKIEQMYRDYIKEQARIIIVAYVYKYFRLLDSASLKS